MRTRECVADSLVCEGHDSYGRRCAYLFSTYQIQHDDHPQSTSFTSLDISSTLLSAPEFGIQARVVVACFKLDVMDIRVHNRAFLLAQQSVSFLSRPSFNSDTEPICLLYIDAIESATVSNSSGTVTRSRSSISTSGQVIETEAEAQGGSLRCAMKATVGKRDKWDSLSCVETSVGAG
jgi:hypothetical protein